MLLFVLLQLFSFKLIHCFKFGYKNEYKIERNELNEYAYWSIQSINVSIKKEALWCNKSNWT